MFIMTTFTVADSKLTTVFYIISFKKKGFFGDSVVKTLPANVRDMGSISGLGRSHMPQSNRACALEPWSCTY